MEAQMTKNALCQIYLYKVSQVYHCWLGHSFNITEQKYNTIRVTAQKKGKKIFSKPRLFVCPNFIKCVSAAALGRK